MLRHLSVWTVLLLFAVFAADFSFAQNTNDDQQRRDRRLRQEREAQQRSEAMFQGKPPAGTTTVFGRSIIHSIDKGFGNTLVLVNAGRSAELQKELGITESQAARLKASQEMLRGQVVMNIPKYVGKFKNMTEADHENIQKELEADYQKITDHFDTLVTPEQKDNSRRIVFQTLGGLESPMMNLDAMSVLKLSDEQKEKAEKTFKEMEKERINQMEETFKLIERAIELGGADMSPEDRAKIEAEGKVLEARIYATGKNLGEQLRTHLTSEQLELEKKLIAQRPAFLPPIPRQMRGDFSGEYSPGLNSWMPGQGAPKDNTEQKRRRRPFPQKENADPK